MRWFSVSVFFFVAAAGPALAQESLGLSSAAVTITAEEARGTSLGARLAADFAVTGNHGLQLDLDYADYGDRRMGRIGGHLYLMPAPQRKYGLFASYGDFDAISAFDRQLGIEGIFAAGGGLTVEGRLGLGVYEPGNMDFIFAGGAADYALNDRLSLRADLLLAQIDELAIDGTVYDAGIGAVYDLPASPWRLEARLGAYGMEGAGHELGLRLGLTATLGGAAGAGRPVGKRLFTRQDAVDVLSRLGRL